MSSGFIKLPTPKGQLMLAVFCVARCAVFYRQHGIRYIRRSYSETRESSRLGVHSASDDGGLQIHRQLVTATHLLPHHHGKAQIPLGSTRLDSTRLDSTRSTLSSQSSQSRRECRARRAVLFQHGGRRTILYKFSRFYALAYTNLICFIK